MKSRYALILLFFLGFIVHISSQEVITNSAGQKILLKEDKTWSIIPNDTMNSEPVVVWNTYLEQRKVNYSDSIALHINYENKTDKKVIGIVVYVKIINPFDEIVFETTLNDEALLQPKEKKESDSFWHFDDNQFIKDQPYDRMWRMTQNGTARIQTSIQKVIFSDGTKWVTSNDTEQ